MRRDAVCRESLFRSGSTRRYKHGKVRTEEEYELQLCAQAMCLEEMYQTSICEGALFYISSHRRFPVKLTEELRERVCQMVDTAYRLCSLQEYCAVIWISILPLSGGERK